MKKNYKIIEKIFFFSYLSKFVGNLLEKKTAAKAPSLKCPSN